MTNIGVENTARTLCSLTTNDISSADFVLIMTQVDNWLTRLMGGSVKYAWEDFESDMGEDRFFVMKLTSSVSAFNRVFVDGTEMFQYDKNNKVQNANLEDGTDSSPDYWDEGTETNATLSWSTTYAKTGRYSLKITKSGASDAYWESDSIQTSEGDPFHLKGWIKTVSLSGANGAWLRIAWFDGSGDALATDDMSGYATGTVDWTEYTVTAYAPEEAATAKIRLMCNATSGDVYFDRFFFSKRNWVGQDLTSTPTLEFTEIQPNKLISIKYTNTSNSDIIVNLAQLLYARNALLSVTGGTVTGLSYNFADQSVDKGGLARNRMDTIAKLQAQIDSHMQLISVESDEHTDGLMFKNNYGEEN